MESLSPGPLRLPSRARHGGRVIPTARISRSAAAPTGGGKGAHRSPVDGSGPPGSWKSTACRECGATLRPRVDYAYSPVPSARRTLGAVGLAQIKRRLHDSPYAGPPGKAGP
jgi:hypothetical protein